MPPGLSGAFLFIAVDDQAFAALHRSVATNNQGSLLLTGYNLWRIIIFLF
jgi:hypothetical protein